MHETITNNYAQILIQLIICRPGGWGGSGILETGGEKPFLGLEIDNMGLFGGERFSGGFILNIYLFILGLFFSVQR